MSDYGEGSNRESLRLSVCSFFRIVFSYFDLDLNLVFGVFEF